MRCRLCGQPYRLSIGCGKRFDTFCSACAKRWRRRTFARYYAAITRMRRPKLVTLTLRKGGGTEKRLKSLWRLRKRLFFYLRRNGVKVESWVGVIEPPNHIHMVVDMDYVPKVQIVEMWHRITGDSYIIDIRKLNLFRSPRTGAAYITKYLSKASAWDGINLDRLAGFHLIGSHHTGDNRRPFECVCCNHEKTLTIVSDYDFYAVIETGIDGRSYGDFGPGLA